MGQVLGGPICLKRAVLNEAGGTDLGSGGGLTIPRRG